MRQMFSATPSDELVDLHANSLYVAFADEEECARYVHELQSLGYDARQVATRDSASVLLRLAEQKAPLRFVWGLEAVSGD